MQNPNDLATIEVHGIELHAKYMYHDDRREWIGIIYDSAEDAAFSLGVEFTESDIKLWCVNTMMKMEETQDWNCEAPDAYDRNQVLN